MPNAIIDIGSRSIKLVIGEKKGDDIVIIESLKNTFSIANDTFLKERISRETINQTVNILEKYKQVLKDYGVTEVKVIATTAVREARNKDIFVDTVSRKTGLNVEVLTVGDIVYYMDSYLSYKLKNDYPIHKKNVLIAELGSGSMDISVMEQGFTLMSIGLPLGTTRLRQLASKLEGSFKDVGDALSEYVINELSYAKRAFAGVEIDDIIIIDETYSAYVHNIIPDLKKDASFSHIEEKDVKVMLESLVGKSAQAIAQEYNIPVDDADTIMPYAVVLNAFYTAMKGKQVYALEISLAESILANILLEIELSKKYNKTNQLVSAVNFICRRYNADLKHSAYVASISEKLFNALYEQLGVNKDDSLYLTLAAYLHDVGMFIHNRSHHIHSEYVISTLNMFRLTEAEIKMIACIARYHRKGAPSKNHLLYGSLAPDKQILVQKLSSILRMANALDRSHRQKVKKFEVKAQNNAVNVIVSVEDNFIMEEEDFSEKKELFEEITGSKISLSVKGL